MTEDFYKRVPKDAVRNLLFRKSLLQQAERDVKLQQQLWLMCKDDLLFFINVFLYVFEPRSKRSLPFITWDIQDRAILFLRDKILDPRWVRRDIPIEKSRDMGVTWFCLAVFIWLFIFHDEVLGCVASRVDELVDDNNNHKALFWKLDYFLEKLPTWMRPPVYRAKKKLTNLANGSSINGDSTNPDMFRGDRALYVFLDEFAAVRDGSSILMAVCDVTYCVIANSTHQGVRTAFYEMVKQHRQVDPGLVLRMHWSDHPFKRAGMYRSRIDGKIELFDRGYVYPKDYKFVEDGKLRSPAYDDQARTRHARHMAQEWDINPVGADWQYFKPELIDQLLSPIGGTARPVLWRGEIEYLIDPIRFVRFREQADGRFLFWCQLDGDFAQRDRQYGGGIDCGRGVGSSNSAIVIADRRMREMVMEFADPFVKMDEFADICTAVGQCFGGLDEEAFLVWEANGPGSEFRQFLMDRNGYRNVFMRSNEKSLKKKKSTYEPGWWSNREYKQKEFGLYEQALRNGTFINRSEDNLKEHLNIIWTTSDRIVHNGEMEGDDDDPAGAGYNHGDRVTAAVLCHKSIGPVDISIEENAGQEYLSETVVPGTFSERFAEEMEFESNYNSRGWRRL